MGQILLYTDATLSGKLIIVYLCIRPTLHLNLRRSMYSYLGLHAICANQNESYALP